MNEYKRVEVCAGLFRCVFDGSALQRTKKSSQRAVHLVNWRFNHDASRLITAAAASQPTHLLPHLMRAARGDPVMTI